MTNNLWRIGEIAERTGISVRTLHHYEEIGLLVPSDRSDAQHRLYSPGDLERLQKIVAMRQLGVPLEHIKSALDQPGFSVDELFGRHAALLKEQMQKSAQLSEKLENILRFQRQRKLSGEELLGAIALMQEAEAMYTPEEMAEITARGQALGKETVIAVEQEWPRLMAAVKEHMAQGTDPADPAMQALARRWKELVEAFTGGNPAIAAKLKKMYEEKPKAAQTFGGPDPAMMAYVQKAMACLE